MKHFIFILIAVLITGITAQGQDEKIPDGVYLDVAQLQKHTPAYNLDLVITEMENRNQDINRNNDYDLSSRIDTITRSYIKHNIFAYIKDGSVYLNCYDFGLSTGFAICETDGRYLAFYAAMPDRKAVGDEISRGLALGFFGGINGSKIINPNHPLERYVYVLNMRSGRVSQLNEDYLYFRFIKYPDLQDQYCKELFTNKDRVLIRYTDLLNRRLEEVSDSTSK